MTDIAIGQEVNLHSKDGAIFHGIVFCFDMDSDLIVLEEPHEQSSLRQDTRIIKYSSISKFEVLKNAGPIADLPALPVEMIKSREAEGLARGKREFDRIGKDVTHEAQLLFNVLDKTYKLRWDNKDIRFSELGIVIKPPYQPVNCSGKDSAALSRIQQLVSTINDRIKRGEVK